MFSKYLMLPAPIPLTSLNKSLSVLVCSGASGTEAPVKKSSLCGAIMETQSTMDHPLSSPVKPPVKRPFSRVKLIDALWGYLFIAPQFLGFLFFVLGPTIAIFVYSLMERNLLSGKTSFIGLGNFVTLFSHDPLFPKVLGNTLIFTAGLVPLNLALALVWLFCSLVNPSLLTSSEQSFLHPLSLLPSPG